MRLLRLLGGCADTVDTSWLVQSGSIFGAGLDVTDPDPADPDNPLLDMENVTVLPHMACAATTLFALVHKPSACSAALCLCSSALRDAHRTLCLLRSFGGSDNTAAPCPLPLPLLFVPLRPVDLRV